MSAFLGGALSVPPVAKVGVALNVKTEFWPVNGLRHPPRGDTAGWYLWAGEDLSMAEDFFVPLHASHLRTWRPIVLPYLALAPGYRFPLAPDYEDVWWDESLLRV